MTTKHVNRKPASTEWLLGVGFTKGDNIGTVQSPASRGYRVIRVGCQWMVRDLHASTTIQIPCPKTNRSGIRAMCALWGIELAKEPATRTEGS